MTSQSYHLPNLDVAMKGNIVCYDDCVTDIFSVKFFKKMFNK